MHLLASPAGTSRAGNRLTETGVRRASTTNAQVRAGSEKTGADRAHGDDSANLGSVRAAPRFADKFGTSSLAAPVGKVGRVSHARQARSVGRAARAGIAKRRAL